MSVHRLIFLFAGSQGTPVALCANYFPLKTVTNWCLYHYNVSFNPSDEDRVFIKKQLIRDKLRELTQGSGFLFDGNSLFLSVKLPQDVSNHFSNLVDKHLCSESELRILPLVL